MNTVIVTVLSLYFACALVVGGPATDCEEGVFPDNVVISIPGDGECKTAPCVVHPGKNVSITMSFLAPTYLENIKPKAVAHTGGIDVNFPLSQNACDGITNTVCPISEGEPVDYNFQLTLPSALPDIQLGLSFSIVDEDSNEKNVVCINIDLQVKNQ